MQCPVCAETQLVMATRQDVEIDHCPKCRSLWPDRGELDKIIKRRRFFKRPFDRSTVDETVAVASKSRQSWQAGVRALRISALVASASLMACAAVDEPRYALKDGWRAARIDEIGPSSTLRQVTSEDCREAATTVQRKADRFAVVSYWSTVPSRKYPSGWFPRIVPLDSASLNVGDPVYVNTLDCGAPVVARTDRR